MTSKTHFIGGHRIEEVSGASPADDPLDREDTNGSSSTQAMNSRNAKSGPAGTQPKTANKSASSSPEKRFVPRAGEEPVGDSRSGNPTGAKKKRRTVAARKTITQHAESASDTDYDDQADEDYSSQSEDSGERSDKRRLAKNAPQDTVSAGSSKQAPTPSPQKRRPGRPFGSKNVNKNRSPARVSKRMRGKNGESGADAGASSDAHSETVRTPSLTSGASSAKRVASSERSGSPVKKAVKGASPRVRREEKMEKPAAVRHSPEIHAPLPSCSSASSCAAGCSSHPVGFDCPSSGRRPKISWSSDARAYIEHKPENVKTLITEKPVVRWDYSDVASFIGAVPELEQLSVTILTEQIDGQCLLIYDHGTWQKGFGVKVGKAVKLVKEVKTLQRHQEKDFLRQWHEDLPKLFAAALDLLASRPSA